MKDTGALYFGLSLMVLALACLVIVYVLDNRNR